MTKAFDFDVSEIELAKIRRFIEWIKRLAK